MGKENGHKCETCSYKTHSIYRLRRHVKSVHEKIRPLKCEECSYSACENSDMKRHVRSVHEKIRPYKCTECPYKASTNHDVRAHVNAVHKYKRFECDKCTYSASFKSNLKAHQRTVHDKIRDKKCDLCDFAFPNHGKLKTHIMGAHLGKTHSCPQCAFVTGFKTTLEMHMKVVHSDLKEILCVECNKMFKTRTALVNHVRRKHNMKQKTKQCNLCDKTFSSNGEVKSHIVRMHGFK